jgi:hypothetical protein
MKTEKKKSEFTIPTEQIKENIRVENKIGGNENRKKKQKSRTQVPTEQMKENIELHNISNLSIDIMGCSIIQ